MSMQESLVFFNTLEEAIDVCKGFEIWEDEYPFGYDSQPSTEQEPSGDWFKCNGCGQFWEDFYLFKYVDSVGLGTFCQHCLVSLMTGESTPSMPDIKLKIPYDLLLEHADSLLERLSAYMTKGAEKAIQAPFAGIYGTYASGAAGYAPKCAGHLKSAPLVEGKGNLILSSSRFLGAKIHDEADIAIFFDSSWRSKVPLPIEVFGGTNGLSPPSSLGGKAFDGPIVFLPWKDYSAPPPGIEIYVDYVSQLLDEGRSVQVGCIGGHGRTGTFAAALFLKNGIGNTVDEAIHKLRDWYCEDAVETNSQWDWLCSYNGEPAPVRTPVKTVVKSSPKGKEGWVKQPTKANPTGSGK